MGKCGFFLLSFSLKWNFFRKAKVFWFTRMEKCFPRGQDLRMSKVKTIFEYSLWNHSIKEENLFPSTALSDSRRKTAENKIVCSLMNNRLTYLVMYNDSLTELV